MRISNGSSEPYNPRRGRLGGRMGRRDSGGRMLRTMAAVVLAVLSVALVIVIGVADAR